MGLIHILLFNFKIQKYLPNNMRIHSLTKTLTFPLIALSIYIFYTNYDRPFEDKGLIFIPVFMMVILYVFNGPIDHWWMSKYPIKFDSKLDELLTKHFRPYTLFDEATKKKFQDRLTLYIESRLFQSVGSEMKDVPYDIKAIISAHGVYLTLEQKDYLIGDVDRIFLYKHPFPTPDHPYLHNVEFNKEDGVIILSIEQLTKAIISPDAHYNVAYHAYAEAILATTKEMISIDTDSTWADLEQISGINKTEILNQIGLKDVALYPVHITLFMSMPEKYHTVLPNQYQQLHRIFVLPKTA